MPREQLGKVVVEGGLTVVPLVSALAALGLGWISHDVVAALVVVTFGFALALLVMDLSGEGGMAAFGRLILLVGFVVWYAYPAIIGEFTPGYGSDSYGGIEPALKTKLWALVCMSSFLLSGILTMAMLRRSVRAKWRLTSDQKRRGGAIVGLASAACLGGLATYLVLGEGFRAVIAAILEGRSAAKPWIQQENLGDAISALTYVTSSAMVAGAALGWIGAGDGLIGPWRRSVSVFLAGVVSVVVYLDHGTRSLLLLVVGPALTVWWMSRFQRSKIGSLAILVMLTPLIFVALQIQMLYRLEATRVNLGDLLFERWLTLGGTIDFFRETLIALELVPEHQSYFRESAVLQVLISPIPRFMWPEKPASDVVWFYTAQRWNVDVELSGGNVLPGVIGQFYMSWGMIGPVLAGALFGLILVYLEKWLVEAEARGDRFSLGVGAMVGLWVFVSFRLLSPGFAYPVLAAATIVVLGGRRANRRSAGRMSSAERMVS